MSGDAGATKDELCLNCGAVLAGPYCHACGQRAHLHRSLLHFGEELAHGLVHFDAKGWRTLPLLVVRPGLLTRRYIDGQRTRYVSPLALFLFCVFVMFFVFSVTGTEPKTPGMLDEKDRAEARAELAEAVAEARIAVTDAQTSLDAARATQGDVVAAEARLATARQRATVTDTALKAFDSTVRAPGETEPRGEAAFFKDAASAVHTGVPVLDAAIRRQLANPELAIYKLRSAASKYSFMLVPISLPFLWVLFLRRRDVKMYDHAVFALYSLSFMSLLLAAVTLISPLVPHTVAPIMSVVPPLHMFLQLRGTYGLSVAGALWRTALLMAMAGLVLLLYLAFIAAVIA